jgi:hypothetical protein
MAQPTDLIALFVQPLNRFHFEYMVTGSAASMAYGEPRLTLDIDLVISLPHARIVELPLAFPPESFYCPPPEVIRVETDRERRGHFNVIHMETGFKADFYPAGDDPLHAWGMAHRKTIDMEGTPVQLAPPEYVILRKLEYYREGGSEKHLRDIAGMWRTKGLRLDEHVLAEWAGRLGLENVLAKAKPKP